MKAWLTRALSLLAALGLGCGAQSPAAATPSPAVPAAPSYVIIGDSVASTGTYWPAVAAAIPATWRNCAVGSTSVHVAWQPGGSAYDALRAAVPTSPTAFLMHIGANDTVLQPPPTQASVFADLERFAHALQTAYPSALLYVADVGQVWTYGDRRAENAAVRAAIEQAWRELPTVRRGPQMGDLTPDDGVHFTSAANVETIARRWVAALAIAKAEPA